MYAQNHFIILKERRVIVYALMRGDRHTVCDEGHDVERSTVWTYIEPRNREVMAMLSLCVGCYYDGFRSKIDYCKTSDERYHIYTLIAVVL